VARAVAWRTLHNVFTNPSLFIPSLVFPLFFFTAFAGGLSSIQHVPGFDYKEGYTAFQFVFVLLQSAAFGGVFTGIGIARAFESGFARRLLLQGWIHGVAVVNPLTRVLEADRGFLAGTPTEVGAAFAAAVLLAVGSSLWAFRGLRKAEAAG